MSLSTFLDLVWTEIWDDCSAMSDRVQYRQIMKELFLDGTDPFNIFYTDSNGKKQRLAKSPMPADGVVPKDQLAVAREWKAIADAARAPKSEPD